MMASRRKKYLSLPVFFAIMAGLGFSQQWPRVGVVNSQEVLEKSVEGKKVLAQLEEKDKKNASELGKLDEDIRQLEKKLSSMTLADEAALQMRDDLEKKRTQRQRKGEDAYRSLRELQDKLFIKLQNELIPIIEKIGKDKSLDLIFDAAPTKSGIVYFNPSIDITDEVIKKYDEVKASGMP